MAKSAKPSILLCLGGLGTATNVLRDSENVDLAWPKLQEANLLTGKPTSFVGQAVRRRYVFLALF